MIIIRNILSYLNSIGIEYVFNGEASTEVKGFSSLRNYEEGTFTWIKNEASCGLICGDICLAFIQEGLDVKAINTIHSSNAKLAFFNTIEHFYSNEPKKRIIGVNTYIAPTVKLGLNVAIGSNCTLDGDIVIGNDTIIGNNVTVINKVKIGRSCQIYSGAVIGHNGFSWTEDENGVKTMIKHFGGVEIGNNVLVGPNSVIDRGTIDNTLIRDGVKIDALCFIAHNVIVNENAILIAGSKLYGSSNIGRNAYIATGIIRNQCSIGKNAVIGMGAVVINNVSDDTTVVGNPAQVLNKG